MTQNYCETAWISIGSNLGNLYKNIFSAISALTLRGLLHNTILSPLFYTEPQDIKAQPFFLNAVIRGGTILSPLLLLDKLQEIENDLGRQRAQEQRHGPRVIDLDLILYGKECINNNRLIIPHPRMCKRRFVLEPLLSIDKHLRHPQNNVLLTDCLVNLSDQVVEQIIDHR